MIAIKDTQHLRGATDGASSELPKPAQRAQSITGRPYLSWSQVASYSLCPKAFEFRYVIKEAPDFVPSSLVFGTAFHEAVALITQADLEGAPRPATADLVAGVSQHLRAGETPLRLGKGESLESLAGLATRMLDAYAASPESHLQGSAICIEDSSRGSLRPDLPPIEARTDLVYRRPDGSIAIRDVKTTRTKWSASKVAEAAPQLRLYRALLDVELKGLGKVDHLEFLTVTKAARPVVAVHAVPSAEVHASSGPLAEQIHAVWHGISSGVFPARPGWPCKTCPFASKCPAAIKSEEGSHGE